MIGNVLGGSYSNTYQTPSAAPSGTEIYNLGWHRNSPLPDDPRVEATLMRWGNYDTVTGTSRFLASEVPSGLAQFANPLPAAQALPPSLYLSARPAWWSTPWGTPPWPSAGPDVTGGDVPGYAGHAYKIPARLCYENSPIDSAHGSANVRIFNPGNCYQGGTPPPSDIIPPAVSMTGPANGATVSGTIAVSANASDNVGVAGVQFQLDGVDLGAELTAAPYSLSWNTTTASDGAHTLTAVARDAAGNLATSAPVSVTTLNTAPTPPVISNVAASNVTSSSATLTWTTNAVSSSQVEYGRSTAYGNVTLLDTSLVTVHSQTLSGLGKNTWYHYRVLSRHAGGNLAVSGDFAFKTRPK